MLYKQYNVCGKGERDAKSDSESLGLIDFKNHGNNSKIGNIGGREIYFQRYRFSCVLFFYILFYLFFINLFYFLFFLIYIQIS